MPWDADLPPHRCPIFGVPLPPASLEPLEQLELEELEPSEQLSVAGASAPFLFRLVLEAGRRVQGVDSADSQADSGAVDSQAQRGLVRAYE